MLKLLSVFILFSTLVALVDSMAGLRFSADTIGPYAEFNGWPMPTISELQFYFKTGSRKSAILLYQDNGVKGKTKDYLEVSLVKNGYARLLILGNRCPKTELLIKRNFTDNSWHKLTITRRGVHLNLSVDNISSEIISCAQPPRFSALNGKAQSSLFMGGIPLLDSQRNPTIDKWSKADLFSKVSQESRWEMVKCVTWNCGMCDRAWTVMKLLQSASAEKAVKVSGNLQRVTFLKFYFGRIMRAVVLQVLNSYYNSTWEIITESILIVGMK